MQISESIVPSGADALLNQNKELLEQDGKMRESSLSQGLDSEGNQSHQSNLADLLTGSEAVDHHGYCIDRSGGSG